MIAVLAATYDPKHIKIPHFGKPDECAVNNHFFCLGWFRDHWSDTFAPALGQHVILTLIAVAIGFGIAFALALAAARTRWLESTVVGVTTLLYVIPSLAMFQILVPFSGLTRLTVEIALVIYTLLLLFRNIVTGLRDVPAEVRDSARGMGMTELQILRRIELPLALPAIFTGLRVATVTTISIATIAAFVIPDGLGAPIFDAIQRNNFKTEFIGAAVLTIALALAADLVLVGAQTVTTPWMRRRRR